MEQAFLAIAVLACPLGMGLCMWMMARGMRGGQKKESDGAQASVVELRHEQEQISARIAELETDGNADRSLARR